MRLLVIANVYRPDLGGGVLFADFCEGLSERGFDVEVRCAYPYYPEWRDKTGANGLAVTSSTEHGVLVRRFGLYIPRNPAGLVQRLLYEASFFASLIRHLPSPGEFDLVMAYCPLVGSVAYGGIAAKSVGCPLWLNVQDLSADAATAAGIVRTKAVGSLFQRVQAFLFNRAETWSTISPVMLERLAPSASRGQEIHYIPNWLHGSLARAIADAPPQASGDEDEPIRLLYSGNIGAKQDLLKFCRHLGSSDARFVFRIQGAGTGAEAVQRWISGTEDDRFQFHALASEASLAASFRKADLFVVTEKQGAGGSFIPSKLLPAYGSGTAVLSISDKGTPLEIEMATSEAGLSLRWNQLDEFVLLLQNPASARDVVAEWRVGALKRATYFCRERIIDQYAELMRLAAQTQRER